MATGIEVINPDAQRGNFRFALFDFDGTLSLIREGWQGVMIPYFVEQIAAVARGESTESIEASVHEFVARLTGKQTIYQCFQLVEEIEMRGGRAREPLEYKHEYLRRLWERIEHRVAGLRSGEIEPDSLLLPGSRRFLQALQDRGIGLYLASGTDIVFVKHEAAALKIDHFFGSQIYGAVDQYRNFSKQMIIDRIISENRLGGPELLVVGDGYVEIENGKGAGGFALGIASDEAHPGQLDEWKRTRLMGAGADAIIADFSETDALVDYLGIV